VPVHGLAHITGGGLTDNIPRVLPESLEARLQRQRWPSPSIFEWLSRTGNIPPAEMYRTFNCGIGMIVIVAGDHAGQALQCLAQHGEQAMLIGEVQPGARGVVIE
jgi:phosphoribosylformylglycinamidine cyclo-ligase